MQNKAFFFGNVDLARKNTPSGFSLDGSAGQQWDRGRSRHSFSRRSASSRRSTASIPGGLSQFSKPQQQRQGFRAHRFQPLVEESADGARQLHERARRTVGTHDQRRSTSCPMRLLQHSGQGRLDRRPAEHDDLGTQPSTSSASRISASATSAAISRASRPFPFVRVDFPDGNNIRLGTENSSHGQQAQSGHRRDHR